MSRTDATGERKRFGNLAEAHMVLDDGTCWHTKSTDISTKTIMRTAGGVKDRMKICCRSPCRFSTPAIMTSWRTSDDQGLAFQTPIYDDVGTFGPTWQQVPRNRVRSYLDTNPASQHIVSYHPRTMNCSEKPLHSVVALRPSL